MEYWANSCAFHTDDGGGASFVTGMAVMLDEATAVILESSLALSERSSGFFDDGS